MRKKQLDTSLMSKYCGPYERGATQVIQAVDLDGGMHKEALDRHFIALCRCP
jgi:hypothetical protein